MLRWKWTVLLLAATLFAKPLWAEEPKLQLKREQVDFGHKPGAGVEASFEPHRNTAKGRVNLSGTLTLPKGKGPFPAVILLSGTGPQDRDETMFGHKPFRVIAEALSRRGIAVLRYDDRGVGRSTGQFFNVQSHQQYADDAQAAVLYLRTRKDIDKGRIGLCGHSEGGVIAPIVATRTDAVGFVVLLAAPGVNGKRLTMLQRRLILKANGAPEAYIKNTEGAQEALLSVAISELSVAAKKAKMASAIRRLVAKATPQERARLGNVESFIKRQQQVLLHPWYVNFLKHDPVKVLKAVRCPVLSLCGDKDLQVNARQNFPPLMRALEEGGNKDYMFIKLPGLNHLFQRCKTGSPSEYPKLKSQFSATAIAWLGDWIRKREAWKPALSKQQKQAQPKLY